MKKNLCLLLAALFCLAFAACGSETAPEPAPAPVVTEVPAATEAPAVTEAPAAEPTSDPTEELKALVLSLKDHPVEELYAAIGEPGSSDYSSSCLVMGADDGVLYYDGFTVYTLRTADGETVYDVE